MQQCELDLKQTASAKYQRGWYARNRERAKAYQAEYRKTHPEINARHRSRGPKAKKVVMAERPKLTAFSTRTSVSEPVEKWIKNWNRIEICDRRTA